MFLLVITCKSDKSWYFYLGNILTSKHIYNCGLWRERLDTMRYASWRPLILKTHVVREDQKSLEIASGNHFLTSLILIP